MVLLPIYQSSRLLLCKQFTFAFVEKADIYIYIYIYIYTNKKLFGDQKCKQKPNTETRLCMAMISSMISHPQELTDICESSNSF